MFVPRRLAILAAAVLMLSSSFPADAQRRKKPVEAPPATSATPAAAPVVPIVSAAQLKGVKARSIGPAIMGGRVSDIAFDPSNPAAVYLGMATGGVFRTENSGTTFSPIFDDAGVGSIGAVAVAPSDSKVIWIGTGEANDRNSSGWGNGVYRSTDGGATWTHVGLRDSRTIARIVVKPDDPKTAWVAAMGDLWTSSAERGLYKTTDGGATWQRVLEAPSHKDLTGCGDVAVDPSNPNVVFAALYARRRTPWSFESGPSITGGDDVGGIFKSVDGGATWKKLANGLVPATQRIGISIHAKNSRIVYAVVQSSEGGASGIDDVTSRKGGVFRSDDGGETWRRMSGLNPRPFYFSQIRVDPANDKRVYVLGFGLHVSDDGGATWREDLFEKVHPDCHALAIDPRDPKRIVIGTDGGAYQSYEGGRNWYHFNKFPAGEFYRIAVDNQTPYRIAGGLQDNLNWVGKSATRSKDGITNSDWTNIGGGDGFYCIFDQDDPNVVYAESQEGFIHRFNLGSGALKVLRPEPNEGQQRFRFHWNSPFVPSLHAKGTMYLAGNRVFRLTNRAEEWKLISPDLSANDHAKYVAVGSGAENYGVVYTLAESPLKAGMLWAGTDDGKLWLTEDEGANWTDLSANLPEAARGQWMNRIEPSHFDAKVAYLAVTAFRSGNYAPLVYRTDDAGRTWRSVAGNLPADGPVRVIREDLSNRSLLFAGTEFGLFASFDGGGSWNPLGGLPPVMVDDVVIHPRDRDLVIATHGRSLYVIDDIRPLEELTPATAALPAQLFAPRPAHGFVPLDGFEQWTGRGDFRGENPPEGAILWVWVREYTGDPVKLTVTNSAEQTVANLTAPGTPGLNRVVWDLKPSNDVLTQYGGEGRKFVKPGEYTVTLAYGKTTVKQKLTVTVGEGIETR